jgi:hypothetical protein
MFHIQALPPFTVRIRALSALLVACAALGAGAPSAAVASHSQAMFFEAPHDLLGSAGTRHKTFVQMQALGVKALRLELHWHDVALGANSARRPHFDATNPASYRWGSYDAVLLEAQRLKWQVLLTVTAPVPRWATSNRKAPYITRPGDKQFEEFMTAVGRHYGSLVSVWAVWNEPNIAGWLLPQWNSNGTPASPRIYRGLFQAGYQGLKAAGITSPKMLFGETAPFGVDRVSNARREARSEVAPLAFLREALCLSSQYRKAATCGKLPVYGYAHHPYTYPAVQGVFYRPPERDQVTIGSLSRLSNALDLAARAQAIPAHIPMYLTEYGVQSKPNQLGVSLTQQVEYDAASEKIAWNNPRVVAFSQYLLTDEAPHGGLTGYRTGLETQRGGLKPLYFGFPIPLVVSRQGSGFSLWGLVRPATGVAKVRVLVKSNGSRGFRTLKIVSTTSSGYWSLHSSTQGTSWRVSWRSPSGKVYTGPPIGAS